MGKFSEYDREPVREPWRIHPIWRGIGCVFIIIFPIMAYQGAVELVNANLRAGWVAVPVEFRGPAQFPYLYAYLLVAVLLLVLCYGLLVIFYSLMMRASGGPKQHPYDAPQPRPRTKRRRKTSKR